MCIKLAMGTKVFIITSAAESVFFPPVLSGEFPLRRERADQAELSRGPSGFYRRVSGCAELGTRDEICFWFPPGVT